MKRLLLLLPLAVVACEPTTTIERATGPLAAAQSAAPGQNKAICFQSGAATCTLNNGSAKGNATFKVTGPGQASIYFTGYNNSFYGVLLSQVTQLSFRYSGTPTAGSPRFSVPIDENNDGGTEAFAFVGASVCNNGNGLVDAIKDNTCTIYYGLNSYPNWAAFAAAYPAAEVAALDNYAFAIADDVGTWVVSDVTIGKPGK